MSGLLVDFIIQAVKKLNGEVLVPLCRGYLSISITWILTKVLISSRPLMSGLLVDSWLIWLICIQLLVLVPLCRGYLSIGIRH